MYKVIVDVSVDKVADICTADMRQSYETAAFQQTIHANAKAQNYGEIDMTPREMFEWGCSDVTIIPWSERSVEQKVAYLAALRSRCSEVVKQVLEWISNIADDECNVFPVTVQRAFVFFSGTRSTLPAPHIVVELILGPTDLEPTTFERALRETFKHYYNAGDYAFQIQRILWLKLYMCRVFCQEHKTKKINPLSNNNSGCCTANQIIQDCLWCAE